MVRNLSKMEKHALRSRFFGLAVSRLAMTAMLGVTLLVVASCGSSSGSASIVNGKNCKHIGFLLPESATAARWEAADHPDVVAAVQKYLPGATVDVTNAQGN